MNYLKLIIDFEQWLESHHMPINSQLLWYKLVSLCNRSGWLEWFVVDNQRLMAIMQIRREATFIECRNKLVDAGLIDFKKGKKGSPNKYKINTFKTEVQTEVQTEVYSEVQTEVQTVAQTVDIYKHKHKQNINKNNKKENNTKEKRFIKPTVEEIEDYCKERNNNINPNHFYDFYESKNWYVGKNKMKDWKACIRTWERNSFSNKGKEKSFVTVNDYSDL